MKAAERTAVGPLLDESKNPLAGRLRTVLASNRVADASAWCAKAHVAPSLLSTFFVRAARNPHANLSTNSLLKLAEAVQVPFDWLSGGLGDVPMPEDAEPWDITPTIPKGRLEAEGQLVGAPLLYGSRESAFNKALLHTLNADFDGDTSKLADALECDLVQLEGILRGDLRASKALENRFEEIGGEVRWGFRLQVDPNALVMLVETAAKLLDRAAEQRDVRQKAIVLADQVLDLFAKFVEEGGESSDDFEAAAAARAMEKHTRRGR